MTPTERTARHEWRLTAKAPTFWLFLAAQIACIATFMFVMSLTATPGYITGLILAYALLRNYARRTAARRRLVQHENSVDKGRIVPKTTSHTP